MYLVFLPKLLYNIFFEFHAVRPIESPSILMIVSGEAPFLINVADLSFFFIARPRSHLRSPAPNISTFDQLHVLRLKSFGRLYLFSSKLRLKHLPGHLSSPLWTSLSVILAPRRRISFLPVPQFVQYPKSDSALGEFASILITSLCSCFSIINFAIFETQFHLVEHFLPNHLSIGKVFELKGRSC